MIGYLLQGTRLVRSVWIVVETICKLKHRRGGRLHVGVGAHEAEEERQRCSATALKIRYVLP